MRRCRSREAHPTVARRWNTVLSVLLAVALVGPACVRKRDPGVFVARVNNEYLTPDKVKGALDSTAMTSGPRLRDYVTTWVNASLLYEEARARGMDRSPELNETLVEMKKQLVVNRLIETEVYGDPSFQLTDEEVGLYYDLHKNEYQLTEDVVKVRYVVFSSRDAANTFRSQLARMKSWTETLQKLEEDSVFAASIIQRADTDYMQASQLPFSFSGPSGRELWRALLQLQAGEVTPPTKIDEGYYILTVLGRQKKGDIAELPMVEEVVRDRVLIEKRQRALDQFLEGLRKKYAVQVNLTVLESVDATKEER